MKYQPSLPEHNDNVSHQHPLKEFFLILSGLLGVALAAFWCLGLLVDVAVDRLSVETEAALNDAVAFQWKKREQSFSPRQEAMLQALVDELKSCADLRYPVTVHLTKAKQANAAVFPGGHIMVFSGLLDKVRSRNGLAFVLAHELAHLKHRDHLRAMGRSIVLVAISTALTGSHSDITQLFIPLNQMGTAKYSREREAQADGKALQVLNCLYGHAGGATEFFEALKKDEGESSSGMSHYFASHPELQTRIDNLNRAIKEMQLKIEPVAPFGKGA